MVWQFYGINFAFFIGLSIWDAGKMFGASRCNFYFWISGWTHAKKFFFFKFLRIQFFLKIDFSKQVSKNFWPTKAQNNWVACSIGQAKRLFLFWRFVPWFYTDFFCKLLCGPLWFSIFLQLSCCFGQFSSFLSFLFFNLCFIRGIWLKIY